VCRLCSWRRMQQEKMVGVKPDECEWVGLQQRATAASVWNGQLGWRGEWSDGAHVTSFSCAHSCFHSPLTTHHPPCRCSPVRCHPFSASADARSMLAAARCGVGSKRRGAPRDAAPSLLTEMVLCCFTLFVLLASLLFCCTSLVLALLRARLPPCASVPSGLRAAFALGLHVQAAPRTCLRRTSVPCRR
jgi:hypothetical protein